jgi:hypothetical protein
MIKSMLEKRPWDGGEPPPWMEEVERGERKRPGVFQVAIRYPGRALGHAVIGLMEGFMLTLILVMVVGWLLPLSEDTMLTMAFIALGPTSFGCWWLNMDSENRGWIMFDYEV